MMRTINAGSVEHVPPRRRHKPLKDSLTTKLRELTVGGFLEIEMTVPIEYYERPEARVTKQMQRVANRCQYLQRVHAGLRFNVRADFDRKVITVYRVAP